jgi:hypothetical protein
MTAATGCRLTPSLFLPQRVWVQNGVRVPGFTTKLAAVKEVRRVLSGCKQTAQFYEFAPLPMLKASCVLSFA